MILSVLGLVLRDSAGQLNLTLTSVLREFSLLDATDSCITKGKDTFIRQHVWLTTRNHDLALLYGTYFYYFPLERRSIPTDYTSITFLYSLSILWSLAFARPKSFLASNLARLSCKCVLWETKNDLKLNIQARGRRPMRLIFFERI